MISSATGPMLARYVHGLSAGVDPLVSYFGNSIANSNARFLYTDLRGSVVLATDQNGANQQYFAYDAYGNPDAENSTLPGTGRFGYTGQTPIAPGGSRTGAVALQACPELDEGARMYSPVLGRFLQTDPIGYADGMNMYAYVGNDPVNGVDPTGLAGDTIVVTASTYGGPCATTPGSLNGPAHTLACLDNILRLPLNFGIPILQPGTGGDSAGFDRPGDTPPVGEGPQKDPICNAPLTAPANRGQTISSRRAQVRAEVARAMNLAARTGGDVAAAFHAEVGRNAARLAPGGSWIRGQATTADGNRLYGAITAELGVPLTGALLFGDIDEFIDDALGYVGIRPYDGNFGTDSPEAKRQIRQGAGC